jgi:hypothetical protein
LGGAGDLLADEAVSASGSEISLLSCPRSTPVANTGGGSWLAELTTSMAATSMPQVRTCQSAFGQFWSQHLA